MRRGLRLLICIFALLFLSGCFSEQIATKINTDGSGVNTIAIGLNKTLLGDTPMLPIGLAPPNARAQDALQQLETEIQSVVAGLPAAWKAQSEPWEDSEFKGFKISIAFTDPAMLEAQLNRIAKLNEDNRITDMYQGFKVQHVSDAIEMVAKVKVDGAKNLPPPNQPIPQNIRFRLSWSVEMPSIDSFTEEGIATRDGNNVTWTFPVEQSANYLIQVHGGLKETASPFPYWLIALTALVVVVIAGGVLLITRKVVVIIGGVFRL
jgi:hypothetical protein